MVYVWFASIFSNVTFPNSSLIALANSLPVSSYALNSAPCNIFVELPGNAPVPNVSSEQLSTYVASFLNVNFVRKLVIAISLTSKIMSVPDLPIVKDASLFSS